MVELCFLLHENLRQWVRSQPANKLLYDFSTAFSLEILVQVVKDGRAASQTTLVVLLSHTNAGDQPLYSKRLLSPKFRIFEVDVMNNLSDRTKPGIRKPQSFKQNFEGATIPFVGKFGFIHVESDFSRLRLISFGRDELKLGMGIDKSANEPRACHPIHMNTFPRNPSATLKVLQLLFGLSCFSSRRAFLQSRVQSKDHALCALSP